MREFEADKPPLRAGRGSSNPCKWSCGGLGFGYHICMMYTLEDEKQGENLCPVSPFPSSLSVMKQLTQSSSSWLRFSCFIGTVLSLETMADCFWCALKGLVLAGRLPVNKLHILCEKHACALFQPDFQVPFTDGLIPASMSAPARTKLKAKRLWSVLDVNPVNPGKEAAAEILCFRLHALLISSD